MIIIKIMLAIIIIAVCVGICALVMELFAKSSLSYKQNSLYERFVKRGLDVFLATGAIIVLSPVLLITAVMVRVKLGSPVIFSQERPGKIDPKTGKEKIFKLYKFRTMTTDTDDNGELLPKEKRLTHFGKKLRSTSLDERVIIGQTTESLENKGFREVSPIHFHRGHDLLFYNAKYANFEGVLCKSA